MTRVGDGVTAVADGVLMITRADVNCYLVDTAAGVLLVDGGLPGSRSLLGEALDSLGRSPHDIRAVLLTHGHFDHVGMCDGLLREHGVASHVHPRDAHLARHPYRYAHESPRIRYPIRYPRSLPGLFRMTLAGALGVRGIDARDDVTPQREVLESSGLIPVSTPGHTFGHCGFLWAERGILFSGDALVTYDPYTGKTGPRAVARAATADAAAALTALDEIERTGAGLILPGHGRAYDGGAVAAAAAARSAGID